jgi:hypothetical protein
LHIIAIRADRWVPSAFLQSVRFWREHSERRIVARRERIERMRNSADFLRFQMHEAARNRTRTMLFFLQAITFLLLINLVIHAESLPGRPFLETSFVLGRVLLILAAFAAALTFVLAAIQHAESGLHDQEIAEALKARGTPI